MKTQDRSNSFTKIPKKRQHKKTKANRKSQKKRKQQLNALGRVIDNPPGNATRIFHPHVYRLSKKQMEGNPGRYGIFLGNGRVESGDIHRFETTFAEKQFPGILSHLQPSEDGAYTIDLSNLPIDCVFFLVHIDDPVFSDDFFGEQNNYSVVGYTEGDNASDFIVLGCVLQADFDPENCTVPEDMMDILRVVKPNIFSSQGTKHNGTHGYVAGFGPRAGFDPVDERGLSFGNYVSSAKTPAQADKVKCIESMGSRTMEQADICINKAFGSGNIVRDTNMCFSAISNKTGMKLAGENVLPKPPNYLCGNSCTDNRHNEPDPSYTTIVVPKHQLKPFPPDRLSWEFSPTSDCRLVFPLNEGTIVFYSGCFLRHRQLHNGDWKTKPEVFNWGRYCNRRLMDNVMRSYRRM